MMDWRDTLARALCGKTFGQRKRMDAGLCAFGQNFERGQCPDCLLRADAILRCIDEAGCAIVPEKPTDKMVAAGKHAPAWDVSETVFGLDYVVPSGTRLYPAEVYRAMYAARPK